MNTDSLINLINEMGNSTTRIFQTVISNLGSILFWIGIIAILAAFFYALWEVKRNKASIGDVLSDHLGKIIIIVLIIVAGGIIQNMKPSKTSFQSNTSIILVQTYRT